MNSNREELLFQLALTKSAAERANWLDRECAGDAALRQRLEALLAAHDQPETLLGTQAVRRDELHESPCPGHGPKELGSPLDGPDEAVGQTLGRYKLLERVGEGGCGVVYVAEQTEPVRRRVALKVIKLGMDTKQVVARFEAERQALAMMDHPNIAKVLDAGMTIGAPASRRPVREGEEKFEDQADETPTLQAGRPYFVMELVRGIKITDYCDQANLNTKDRLDLFMKVCQAIQHAHQKGIIHRDIKPSNILVTLHDGVPVPKVIDFGIAKATEGRLTDNTVYTQLHQFIGTPAYMSPEQAEMSGLDIDTRSDIYSLGVLLYELLAGSTPFDAKDLMASGIDAMRRTIREKEPPRPSTRLATLGADELTTTARRRSADSARLLHQLKGDLDWIVMKCLEKDRQRRYETANGLAADIKRHLENEPVTARPPSAVYKFQKALRRNKLVFAACGAVAVALIAGAAAATWQAVRASRAEALATSRLKEATEASASAEQVAVFLQQVFVSPDPTRDGRTIKVADALDRAAARLETELASQPDRRARLQATLASTYASLGLPQPALKLWDEVRAYWVKAAGPDHPESRRALSQYAQSLRMNGKPRQALEIYEDLLKRARGQKDTDKTNLLSLVLNYANMLSDLGRQTDAMRLREENLADHRKILGAEHPETLTALQNLEVTYYDLGMRERAAALENELVELSRKALGPEHPATLERLANLGATHGSAGRHKEAIRLLEEVLEKAHRVLGPEHPTTLHATQTLAHSYLESGRLKEALILSEKALALYRKTFGMEHPFTIWPMLVFAKCQASDGRQEEAIKLTREALALSLKTYGSDHTETLKARTALAMLLWQNREALQIHDAIIEQVRRIHGPEHSDVVGFIRWKADCLAGQGLWREARAELLPLAAFTTIPEEAHFPLMCLAALQAYQNDRDGYEKLRKVLLKRFKDVDSAAISERVAKSVLLLPLTGEPLAEARALAERGIKLTEGSSGLLHWRLFAAALARYRSGEFLAAAEAAARGVKLAQEAGTPVSVVSNHLILALANHRLGNPVQAGEALSETLRLVNQHWPNPEPGLGENWHDILIAHVLLREARGLIPEARP